MTSAPPGKKGGIVLGKMTSAAMPSASRSRHATVGVPVAPAEVAEQVGEQDVVAVDPGVELVVVAAVEEVAVLVDLAAAVAVGGDDDVAVVGVHGVLPRRGTFNESTLEARPQKPGGGRYPPRTASTSCAARTARRSWR